MARFKVPSLRRGGKKDAAGPAPASTPAKTASTVVLLRALLSAFAPPSPAEPELLGQSLLASLWRWPFQPLQHLQDELNKSFGIDLRQSWAFAYIRRALLPELHHNPARQGELQGIGQQVQPHLPQQCGVAAGRRISRSSCGLM